MWLEDLAVAVEGGTEGNAESDMVPPETALLSIYLTQESSERLQNQ